MPNPQAYGMTDTMKFLDVSKRYVQKLIEKETIPYQRTSSGPIFFESDLVAFQLARFEKAKTDPRIQVTEAQRRNVTEALGKKS